MIIIIVLGIFLAYLLCLFIHFGIKILIYHIKLNAETKREIEEINEREKEYGDVFYIESDSRITRDRATDTTP